MPATPARCPLSPDRLEFRLDRRHFLSGALAGLLPPATGCGGESTRELWASAQGSERGTFGVLWVDASGTPSQVASGFRGHDLLVHPSSPERLIFVARHPGRELLELDMRTHTVTRRVTCDDGFVLSGHACASRDGKAIFVVESSADEALGRIVVRDALDYRTLDVFSTHGIGPHEMLLMPDGTTLAIANGGLLTHSESGDTVLNLDTMKSELCFVDSRAGELLSQVSVDEPKASIRHLDVTAEGELSIALQMQRSGTSSEALAPLAALYSSDQGLRILKGPEELLWQCQDYMGSTRINRKARVAGFTSPRGDLALFWDLESGELRGYHRLHDVCGLSVSLDESLFVLSNSAGTLRCLDAYTLLEVPERSLELPGLKWDNHLRTLELTL